MNDVFGPGDDGCLVVHPDAPLSPAFPRTRTLPGFGCIVSPLQFGMACALDDHTSFEEAMRMGDVGTSKATGSGHLRALRDVFAKPLQRRALRASEDDIAECVAEATEMAYFFAIVSSRALQRALLSTGDAPLGFVAPAPLGCVCGHTLVHIALTARWGHNALGRMMERVRARVRALALADEKAADAQPRVAPFVPGRSRRRRRRPSYAQKPRASNSSAAASDTPNDVTAAPLSHCNGTHASYSSSGCTPPSSSAAVAASAHS